MTIWVAPTLPWMILVVVVALSSPVLSVPEDVEVLLKELSGGHLRFSATPIPSLLSVKKNPNGTFTYTGFHVEVVDFVARLLNITYSFVNVNESESDIVGQKEAAINLLLRHEVEVVSFGTIISKSNCDRMDCSFPLTLITLGMMVPWPEESNRILAIIEPFQPAVWLSILLSTVAMTFALVGIPGIYFKFIDGRYGHSIWTVTHLGNAALYLSTNLTGHQASQGNWIRFKQLSFKILIATWCLTTFVLVNAYSSTLISYLTATKLPVTKTLEELAAGQPQKLRLLTDKSSIYADKLFLGAQSGVFKVLGDSLRKHPETLFTNRFKGFEMLYTGRYAYVGVEQFVYALLEAANNKAGFCKFTISNDRLISDAAYAAYLFPKNWRYTDAVNFKLYAWWESGLVDYWLKMYQPGMSKCSLDKYKDATAKHRPLSKIDLFGSFLLLLLGISISFLVFLVERIVALAKIIRGQQ